MDCRLSYQLFFALLFAHAAVSQEMLQTTTPAGMQETHTTERFTVAAPEPITRHPRYYRREYNGKEQGWHEDDDDDDDDDYGDRDGRDDPDMDVEEDGVTEVSQPRYDTDWSNYYDFLVNEGSYKFWAVFQLGTAALLIYSGFAALQYAKENPPEADYEDYYWRRRRRSSYKIIPQEKTFLGLDSQSFQRILDAIAKEFH